MSLAPLSSLPRDARVWCFGASAPLADGAAESLRPGLERFLDGWTAHRAELLTGFAWLHDRFLVIAVDESATGASGCSIDALTGEIRRLEAAAGITLLDASPVWYRTSTGAIETVSREEFRRLADSGEVGPGTPVFDLTVDRLGAVRGGEWEVEAGGSWHARLL